MNDSAKGVRIIQMQQFPMVTDYDTSQVDLNTLDMLEANQKARAEAELSEAVADGYEIANVAVGGNDRVLLTVWTLKPAPTRIDTIEGDNGMRSAFSVPFNQRTPPIPNMEELVRDANR